MLQLDRFSGSICPFIF